MNEVEGVESWSGGPNGTEMQAIFLKPVAITKDNLDTIIDAGWVSKDVVCQGVDAGSGATFQQDSAERLAPGPFARHRTSVIAPGRRA